MKKLVLIITFWFVAFSYLSAQTDVTLRVNMSHATDMYQVTGTVWVYMDNDWSEYYVMTDTDADKIFTYTVQKEAASILMYKFSYQTGPDEMADYVTENVPSECRNANGFRELEVPVGDTVLPAFAYGSCTTEPSTKVNITFQVDMSKTTVLNNDVQAVIKGPWIWTALTDMGNGIWTGTAEVESNGTYPYTFVNGGQDNWSGEEKVPAECNYGSENAPERRITVATEDVTIEPVGFGECGGVVIVERMVTYRVDLNNVTDLYENGAVWVYMDANWNEYYDMIDDNKDGIYEFTAQKTIGMKLPFSFAYQTGADPNSDFITENVPAECANSDGFRELLMPATDTLLPAFAFGSCNDVPPTKVNITFQVDMSKTTVLNNDVQVVIKNPWIWTALTDLGNGIWSGTVEVQSNGTYPYTFVNGGQDNWSGEEKVPAECNYGTESAPERRVKVTTEDLTLEAVGFGECGTTVITKPMVTFRVDMSAETVSAQGVQLVIKEPWIWTAMTDKGNGIWETTVELGANISYPYSYVNGAKDYWAGEEEIVGDCKDGSENQRIAVVADVDMVVPTYIFGTCTVSPNAIGDIVNSLSIEVYPNPANDKVYVLSTDKEISSVTLYNLAGAIMLTPNIESPSMVTVDLKTVNSGVYFIVVKGEGYHEFRKIVVVR